MTASDALFVKRIRPKSLTIETSYTRPADTNVYAAGDVFAQSTSAATILTFAGIARESGGGAIIQGATLYDSSAQATKPDLELYLFDTSITMQNDNVAWAPSDSDMEKCLGVIYFAGGLFRTGSGNGVIDQQGIAMSIACASTLKDIYGILVVRNGYTPTSGEKVGIRLHVIQD